MGWSAELSRIFGKGGIAILDALSSGPKRYGQLAKDTGLEHPTLDRRLKELQNLKIIGRRLLPTETRERSEYFLDRWGSDWLKFMTAFDEDITKQAVQKVVSREKTLNNHWQ